VQAEELLGHLAGEEAPRVSVVEDVAEARRKCRAAWAAWWAGPGAKVDLARAAERERLLGLTLGIEYNTGRVWECAPDGTVRWEFSNLQGPMEAQVLPGGRVLVAESNNHTVSERDLKGNVLWKRTFEGEPTGCQRLPNGNTFVSTYNSVHEVNRDGKEIYSFRLAEGSNAIWRGRNGHVFYAATAEIIEADTTGRKVRSVPLPKGGMYVGIQDLPGNRFMVANSGTGDVLELDAAGKVLWRANVAGACGVARLPNGHTLVAAPQHVVELNRDGKKVWEKTTPGYARRVHRR
jgi:outer membrane protein assembly factor BamB